MTGRTFGRAAVLALATLLVLPAAAGAHPFFREREAPASSLATLTLDLVHGCDVDGDGHAHGGDDDGLGEPTTYVAMELPAAVTYVDPADAAGWVVALEEDDGRVAVVSWTEAGGAEPAPRFELDLVVEGDEGDEVYFRVVQECDGAVYRWIGTPDDPADDPAVRLTLTAPDPDRPPPAPEPATPEGEATADETAPEPEPAPEEPPAPGEPAADDPEPAAAAPGADTGVAWPVAAVIALGLLAIAIGVGTVMRRRREGPSA
jgi:uncharacterized protein YcnI